MYFFFLCNFYVISFLSVLFLVAHVQYVKKAQIPCAWVIKSLLLEEAPWD